MYERKKVVIFTTEMQCQEDCINDIKSFTIRALCLIYIVYTLLSLSALFLSTYKYIIANRFAI